jgi:predicted enzyme related to lactoylglutathione lyase
MFGSNPLGISESFAVPVRNLANARQWYIEKLGLNNGPKDASDDSGFPFVALQIRKDEFLTLIETPTTAAKSDGEVARIFFASNLRKAQKWLNDRGVVTDAIEEDSGGNKLFHFHDLDGNRLEVCQEN